MFLLNPFKEIWVMLTERRVALAYLASVLSQILLVAFYPHHFSDRSILDLLDDFTSLLLTALLFALWNGIEFRKLKIIKNFSDTSYFFTLFLISLGLNGLTILLDNLDLIPLNILKIILSLIGVVLMASSFDEKNEAQPRKYNNRTFAASFLVYLGLSTFMNVVQ